METRLIIKGILYSLLLLLTFDAVANSRQITAYDYDNSGDIRSIVTEVSEQAPLITELSPTIVRHGQQYYVIANGIGLRFVQINADSSGLAILVSQSSDSQVAFTLNVGEQVALGQHTLTFSTSLGFTTQTITVFPLLPEITLNPTPVVLAFPASPIDLDIQLSRTDIVEHTLDLVTIDNPSVAELSVTNRITIPIGQTRPGISIPITGLQKGTATLNITSQTLS